MFGNVVKLVFQSASIGSGLDDFIAKTKAGLTNSNMLGQGVAKLSTIFGGLGASIGGAVNMLLHGGVWGAAAEGVKMVIGAVQKWRAEAALAAEANAKAFAEVQEKAKAAAEQMKSAYQKSNEAIDAAAKKKKEDIELTNKQTKAELELAAAKAKAAGKDKEAAALESKAGAVDAKGKEQSASVDVNAAQQKLDAAKKAASGLPGWKNNGKDFEFDPKAWEKERRRRNGEIQNLENKLNPKTISQEDNISSAKGFWGTVKAIFGLNAYSSEARKKANTQTPQDPTYRDDLKKQLYGFEDSAGNHTKGSKEAYGDFLVQMNKAREAAKNIANAERELTQARKAERVAIMENQKSIVIAKSTAAKASKEQQLKEAQDKLSGKRTIETSTKSEVSKWQGEFNTAFDLWRDPEAAASAVEADKKRGEDMKRFRKEVNRYGGKGKIDEYARLMRDGDEEGMQERLTSWRKSSKFTPQVEQMVKAAAADQNKNAAEKSLANIEKDVSGLAKKIEELLSLK